MINKRLIKSIPDAIPHIRLNLMLQIGGLISNIVFITIVSITLSDLYLQTLDQNTLYKRVLFILGLILLRLLFTFLARKQGYLAASNVKLVFRNLIYMQVTKLRESIKKDLSTAELLQLSVEGVDQLEIYFSSYLPQFFYSMIAPIILFGVVLTIHPQVAIVLFLCVPAIPISIIIIQKIAKRLLAKYWGEYLKLSDHFLENLQGLNTLKIYQSDERKHLQMNKQAEHFRVITMKVLSMQLNSIIVMDIVAYGGAALGIFFALLNFSNGSITLSQAIFITLISAEFFLPLRLLGSYFHIAMNGVAASKKIFDLLDLVPSQEGSSQFIVEDINFKDVSFYYGDKQVLKNINCHFPKNSLISIVGESGSGKSTMASLLTKINEHQQGSITIGDISLNNIDYSDWQKHVALIPTNAYIFKGTVKENLLMADSNASDSACWEVLQQVNLANFLQSEKGLDTLIEEKGSNLSGGQCQRLALARALLSNRDLYIFDEATSNIDVESENDILSIIYELAKQKTIIMISHRLANVTPSHLIHVLKNGELVESGTHTELLSRQTTYAKLWYAQQELEESTYAKK